MPNGFIKLHDVNKEYNFPILSIAYWRCTEEENEAAGTNSIVLCQGTRFCCIESCSLIDAMIYNELLKNTDAIKQTIIEAGRRNG
jgi:hypothetical protein